MHVPSATRRRHEARDVSLRAPIDPYGRMRRTISVVLFSGLVLPHALGQSTPAKATEAAAASGGGGGGGYKLSYQVGGPTVPVWADIGKVFILMFAGDASQAKEFAESAISSPGLGGITGALSSTQGTIGIFMLLGYAILAGVLIGGAAIIGLRQQEKCGGKRYQVVTPDYDDVYSYYQTCTWMTGIALVITSLCLFLNKGDIGTGVSDGQLVYADGSSDLKQMASSAAPEAPAKEPETKKDKPAAYKLRQLAGALNADFRDGFQGFLERRVALDLGLTSRSVYEDCSRDYRNMSRLLQSHGLKLLGKSFADASSRCRSIAKAQKAMVGALVASVEDATVTGRKQLLRQVQRALAREEARIADIAAQTAGGVDGLIAKIDKYESEGGVVGAVSLLGLLGLVIFLLTLVTPLVAIGGMIYAAPEHDNRPTIRSEKSNMGGLIILYSTIGCYVTLIISSYVSIPMYGMAAAGEIYICGPYNNKAYQPLDEIFYTLWPVGERPPALAGFCPSEVLSKCASGGSLSGLQVPSYIKGGGSAPEASANASGPAAPDKGKGPAGKGAPSLQQVNLKALVPAEPVTAVENDTAMLPLQNVLSDTKASDELRQAAVLLEKFSEKWRPLMNRTAKNSWSLGAFRATLANSINRYFAEYMGDIDSRFRWASAQVAKQGGGSCDAAYKVFNTAILLFCTVFLHGVEGFWLGQVMDLILLLVFVPVCFGMSNHFLLMEGYTYGDYDRRKIERREEQERLGLVKKKKKKKRKKKKKKEEEEAEESEEGGDEDSSTDEDSEEG